MKIQVALTQEQIDRINEVLAKAGSDPAYYPGESLLSGSETSEDFPNHSLSYSIRNNKLDEVTYIHQISIRIYRLGTDVHTSTHRIDSLSDSFDVSSRDGSFEATLSFVKL